MKGQFTAKLVYKTGEVWQELHVVELHVACINSSSPSCYSVHAASETRAGQNGETGSQPLKRESSLLTASSCRSADNVSIAYHLASRGHLKILRRDLDWLEGYPYSWTDHGGTPRASPPDTQPAEVSFLSVTGALVKFLGQIVDKIGVQPAQFGMLTVFYYTWCQILQKCILFKALKAQKNVSDV